MSTYKVRNGIIYKDDRPHFPLGMYYNFVPPASTYDEQRKKRSRDLRRIAQLGFTLFKSPIDRHDLPFLSELSRYRMDLLLENNDPDPYEVSRMFSDHPCLVARILADDVDQGRWTLDSLVEKREIYKEKEPDVLSYISGGSTSKMFAYFGQSDLVATQSYPVPDEGAQATVNRFLYLRETFQKRPESAWIANLQAFPWYGTKPYPTPQEIRLMTYGALIGGVKGILWYSWHDEFSDLSLQSQIQRELGTLVSEIKAHADLFLLGEQILITTGRGEVKASLWIHKEKALLVVCNGYRAETVKVGLNVPSDLPRGVHLPFVQVELRPYEVRSVDFGIK